MKVELLLDPYYNRESEHYGNPNWSSHLPDHLDVRRVCSTQTEVRVYSNGPERWHYLPCPIITVSSYSTKDWIRRQNDNVRDALSRIARAKWTDGKAYRKVITELRRADAMIPEGFTKYAQAKK
tara:strand:- start:160 stop:531 length:372 start_codon:yes stop_codon:yes gene_type:complete